MILSPQEPQREQASRQEEEQYEESVFLTSQSNTVKSFSALIKPHIKWNFYLKLVDMEREAKFFFFLSLYLAAEVIRV